MPAEHPPKTLLERIHAVCERFEDQWQAGDAPEIDEYLQGWGGEERQILFQYLLELELDYRGRSGQEVILDDYRDRFPDYAELIATTVRLGDTKQDPAKTERFEPGHSAPPVASVETPSRIGNYDILAEVARGGMGVVYKARQVNANRVVALKMILQGQLAGDGEIARFRTEAQAAARLDHPSIVPVFEVGEIDGRHFFSMGFVDGINLNERLSDGPLTSRDAAAMLEPIVDAVAYAHSRGVIHRDLKPANILLGSDGVPRVTDFGLAKQMDADSDLTATGQVMGTPQYMPPEQATGAMSDIGPLSDVYSLGAVLYAMLTGRPPFQAANILDVLRQVVREDPVAPRRLAPTVDRDLETICLKCLQKDSHRRYESAAALKEDLNRFLTDRPIAARPISTAERAARWCRRNRLAASLLAAVAMLLVGGTLISTLFAIEANQRAEEARNNFERSEAERKRADKNLVLAKKNEAKANTQTKLAEEQRDRANRQQRISAVREYAGQIRLALREIQSRSIGTAREALASTDPELRSWEYSHLAGLCNAQMRRLEGHGKEARTKEEAFIKQVAFSPRGDYIGSGGLDGTLRLWDPKQGVELQRVEAIPLNNSANGRVFDLAFSHDGMLAAACGGYQHQGGMSVVEVASGRKVSEVRGHGSLFLSVDFSPDGANLATLDTRGVLATWNAKTGELVGQVSLRDNAEDLRHQLLAKGQRPTSQTQRIVRLDEAAYAQNGTKLLVASSYGVIVVATEGLQVVNSHGGFALHQPVSSNIALDHERGRYAVATVDGMIHLFDIDSGDAIGKFQADDGVVKLDFGPTGDFMVFTAADGVKVWDIARETVVQTLESRPEGWREERHMVRALAHNPAGQQVLTGSSDGVLRLWSVAPPADSRLVEAMEGAISFAFDQSGKRIVVCGPHLGIHGRAVVWNLDTLTPEHAFQKNGAAIGMAAFSPDGTLLATASKSSPAGKGFSIEVWSMSSKKILYGFEAPTPVVVFVQNGRYLVAADVMLDTETGALSDASSAQSPAILSDRSRVARVQQNQVLLFDGSSQKLLKTIDTPIAQIRTVALTPDGRQVVAGGMPDAEGPSLCVLDAESGELISTLPGDPTLIMSVAVTSDGKRILSAGRGGKIRLFDTETLETVHEMDGIPNLFQVGLSENQRWIAAMGRIGTRQELRLWEAPPDAPAP